MTFVLLTAERRPRRWQAGWVKVVDGDAEEGSNFGQPVWAHKTLATNHERYHRLLHTDGFGKVGLTELMFCKQIRNQFPGVLLGGRQ